MNVAIIPARGGSRRIPRKNIRDFRGKPIITYSIEAATESGLFERIIVSTDDHEIARTAIEYGADSIQRAEGMAEDKVGTQDVMASVLEQLRSDMAPSIAKPELDYKKIEYACCIYPTAPLININDLIAGYEKLKNAQYKTFSFAIGTNPLRDAGQFYWGTAPAFLNAIPLLSPLSIMIPIAENRVMDIDIELDWFKAEQMYDSLHKEVT